LQTLASIFTTDYFERVWIVQEIIIGKTNVCQIGDKLVSLATLTAAAHVLLGLGREIARSTTIDPPRFEINSGKIEHVCRSYLESALQNSWLEPGSEWLHDVEVVTALNQGNCSDPRDYIYGVASLFAESGGYDVDYTLSEAEVFVGFTVHCLKKAGQAFEVLNQDRSTMKSIHAHHDVRSDLPSWCPDWSVAEGAKDGRFIGHESRWQASGSTKFIYSRPSSCTKRTCHL
jgi:hypothetical protein